MSRTHKDSPKYHPPAGRKPGHGRRGQRSISVRAVRRNPPDLRKFGQALIQLTLDEAAAAANLSQSTVAEHSSSGIGETETAADD